MPNNEKLSKGKIFLALKLPSSAENCFLCCHIRKLLATSADLRVINLLQIDIFWLRPLPLTSSDVFAAIKTEAKSSFTVFSVAMSQRLPRPKTGKKRREITKELFSVRRCDDGTGSTRLELDRTKEGNFSLMPEANYPRCTIVVISHGNSFFSLVITKNDCSENFSLFSTQKILWPSQKLDSIQNVINTSERFIEEEKKLKFS